jgi:hypothetical protein
MAKQNKVSGGNVNRCSCGCGRRKNRTKRFAPGCDGRKHRGSNANKPNFDHTKTFRDNKRNDLIQYTGTEAVRINADARAAERSTSLGAAIRRARHE